MNEPATAASVCGRDHCITCADDGAPMTVLRCDTPDGLALCAGPDGAYASVETALLEEVVAGDMVLVHAGVAIASLRRAATLPGSERAAA